MALGKQAKTLTPKQFSLALAHVAKTRRPLRNRVILLLSHKAGLRAKEIAMVSWRMVTDAEGQLGDAIALENTAAKGKRGGRAIDMGRELKGALAALGKAEGMTGQVIKSERRKQTSAAVIANAISGWYKEMGLEGCSSHSGRRTYITRSAKMVTQVGGSLRDVQIAAGHSSLAMTQRYIEGDSDARKKLADLI
jgi:integrase